MQDVNGTELAVGDSVAFATLSNRMAHLRRGWVHALPGGQSSLVHVQYFVGGIKRGVRVPASAVVRTLEDA